MWDSDDRFECHDWHPANIGYSNFKYTKTKVTMHQRYARINGLQKNVKIQSTAMLKATLFPEIKRKEWLKFGKNPMNLIRDKNLPTKQGQLKERVSWRRDTRNMWPRKSWKNCSRRAPLNDLKHKMLKTKHHPCINVTLIQKIVEWRKKS